MVAAWPVKYGGLKKIQGCYEIHARAFRQRRRVGEVRAPQKTLAFFEGGRIWSSPHGRARASGPAALFALWVVFEAAALIYGGVFDARKLFSQKARGSRGRDPEEPPRGGGDERPRACCAMGGRLFKIDKYLR